MDFRYFNHKVEDGHKKRITQRHGPYFKRVYREDHHTANIFHQFERIGYYVPTVITPVPANVNPEGIYYHKPINEEELFETGIVSNKPFHATYRHESQQTSVPGEGQYQQQIIPQRDIATLLQVKKIGDDIKAVR